MSSKQILVVFGATGIQGGSVIKSILGDHKTAAKFSIRAITRDVSKPAAQALVSQGLEVVSGDLNDKVSLLAALKGAYAVFLVTDFWATLSKEIEITQGKNVADAAKESRIQHLIFSSLPSPTEISNGTLTSVYHFDSKAIIESYIRSLSIPATFFMPGMYMSNLPGQNFQLNPLTKTWTLTLPVPPTTPLPLLAAETDTGKFIKAILLSPSSNLGKRIYGATTYITPLEIVREFKGVFQEDGKGAAFVECTSEEMEKQMKSYGMPEAARTDLIEMFRYFVAFGYFGRESLEESAGIVGEALTSWREYMGSEKAVAFKALK